jgi:hypothetical protein
MPSLSIEVASTGQTAVHGGLSQCMHGCGTKRACRFGHSPSISVWTRIQKMVRF